MSRPINCDQVAWMLSAIERHLPHETAPRVSRAREMQKYALLYELMEVADLRFEDSAAQHNGTPPDVFRLLPTKPSALGEAPTPAAGQACGASQQSQIMGWGSIRGEEGVVG